ncbi:MAG: sulfurtransferase [Chloroflexi bacterium]|nr:sulfurtransferase [Chloroflexota bacterium]
MSGEVPGAAGPLVSTAWLAEQLADPGSDVRVVDCRWYLKPFDMRDPDVEYARGHIPGAVHLRWDTHWADADHPIPGMLAQPEAFAEAMASAGIGNSTTVVAYDDGHVTVAARLWWALRVYGHDAAAVLDGGIVRWIAEDRPLSTEVPCWPTGDFTARPRSAAYATQADVAAALDDPSVGLVDCRMEPARAEDGAMIPGSAYLPGIEFQDNGGLMRSPESCRDTILSATERFARTILYCRGGVGACGTALAYEVAGLGDGVSVYDGSWSEWVTIADDTQREPL